MSPIRIVLATLPPLLGDIVRVTLARDADVEILAQVESWGEIAAAMKRSAADVAVLGVAPDDWLGLSGFVRELLADHPRLTIVALASDGRSGYVHRLQPRGVVIDDLTPKSLVQAIRSGFAEDVHPSIHPFSAE